MENWSSGQRIAIGVLYVTGSAAILFAGVEWLDLGLRRAVDLLIVVLMAVVMLSSILWLLRYGTRPTTVVRGFVVEGEYRGVAGFAYGLHFFVEYVFSFYGYERTEMEGFTFGLLMLASGIWLAHYATENWRDPDRRVDG